MVSNGFQKTLNMSNHKPNKMQVEKGSEFHYRSMRSWFQDNDVEMYSRHNEESLLLPKDLLEPWIIKSANI